MSTDRETREREIEEAIQKRDLRFQEDGSVTWPTFYRGYQMPDAVVPPDVVEAIRESERWYLQGERREVVICFNSPLSTSGRFAGMNDTVSTDELWQRASLILHASPPDSETETGECDRFAALRQDAPCLECGRLKGEHPASGEQEGDEDELVELDFAEEFRRLRADFRRIEEENAEPSVGVSQLHRYLADAYRRGADHQRDGVVEHDYEMRIARSESWAREFVDLRLERGLIKTRRALSPTDGDEG